MNSEINSANLHKIQQRLDAMQSQIDALQIEVDVTKDFVWVQSALIEQLIRLIPVVYAADVAERLSVKHIEFSDTAAGQQGNEARELLEDWIAYLELAAQSD